MCDWLASQGIARLSAHKLDDEGEIIWE